jgi:hypothetical protein
MLLTGFKKRPFGSFMRASNLPKRKPVESMVEILTAWARRFALRVGMMRSEPSCNESDDGSLP